MLRADKKMPPAKAWACNRQVDFTPTMIVGGLNLDWKRMRSSPLSNMKIGVSSESSFSKVSALCGAARLSRLTSGAASTWRVAAINALGRLLHFLPTTEHEARITHLYTRNGPCSIASRCHSGHAITEFPAVFSVVVSFTLFLLDEPSPLANLSGTPHEPATHSNARRDNYLEEGDRLLFSPLLKGGKRGRH